MRHGNSDTMNIETAVPVLLLKIPVYKGFSAFSFIRLISLCCPGPAFNEPVRRHSSLPKPHDETILRVKFHCIRKSFTVSV